MIPINLERAFSRVTFKEITDSLVTIDIQQGALKLECSFISQRFTQTCMDLSVTLLVISQKALLINVYAIISSKV